jgi:hypothetical protein
MGKTQVKPSADSGDDSPVETIKPKVDTTSDDASEGEGDDMLNYFEKLANE